MAGIGFELRRLTRRDPGLWTGLRAFAAAGMVSSGPWVLTTATMLLLGVTPAGDDGAFRALVTAAFAWSLILVGGLQTAATRFVADQLYAHRHDRLLSGLAATVALVVPLLALTSSALCVASDLDQRTAVAEVLLTVIVGLQWTAMSWLGVVRRHDRILWAFVSGLVLSVVAQVVLGSHADTAERLLAHATGQAIALVLLVAAILGDTRASTVRSADALRALCRYPLLVATGLVYAIAIWADKIVLWSFDGVGEGVLLRNHPLYDTCAFLAYTTTLPALTANVIHLETAFYESYRAYYGALLSGRTLADIEARRGDMVTSLRHGAARLLKTQSLVTLACIVFAPRIVAGLGLPPSAVDVLRPMCVGALLHVGLLVTLLVLLYFDRRRDALLTSLLFLTANVAGAATAARVGLAAYGFGYAVAALVALVFALQRLGRALANLEYLTFRDAR
ncbi:MAG: exopolysaccharide Pel transporter PelG [Planctomycetes bacterium]|nr:exopolysaccharide Pel transporter PelG [Planctomycetota bacterium]